MNALVLCIPLLPFLGFLMVGLFRNKLSRAMSGILGSGVIGISFILTLVIFFTHSYSPNAITYFNFISNSQYNISFSFQVDQLSTLFMLIITGVGFLIHVYSTAYMREEPPEHYARYFSYLNLFVFSMLLLVLGANYVIMFIGWEGVGICSYLLIGFWFKNNQYNYAARKAFVMNRIGDVGFLLAIFWILARLGSADYSVVFSNASTLSVADVTGITILLFVGAIGKSAQIPLYTWLPDAMAGPTPVSALIHAATMVTAGIYMIARSNVLFSMSPLTLDIVAVIGLATAILAASIALFQNDIKKVLAYSTVSQLGFMFVALGVGAYTTGVFHVMSHSFFKALLFLGAGSVIHAMGGEQDITKMGGLRKKIPITYWTFLIAVLAISGFPFTSGFISKDEILMAAYAHSQPLFWLTTFAAVLTALYMFRVFMLVFLGGFRGDETTEHHLHESPPAMTIPLLILAVLAAIGGFVQLPEIFGGHDYFNEFLAPVVPAFKHVGESLAVQEYYLLGGTIAGLLIIFLLCKKWYSVKNFEGKYSGMKNVLAHKWYIDELYEAIIVNPFNNFAGFLKSIVEKSGIDGIVNGVGRFIQYSSRQVRLIQSGMVGNYILIMVLSITVLFMVFWNQDLIIGFLQKIF